MDIKKYAEWTGNTCAKLENSSLDNLHMLLGMITEIGELSDIFKKELAYKKDVDWVNVKEELGDILYYLSSFCRLNNLDLNEILETNVKKLETRYPNKFSEEKALHRDLDKERSILEAK